MKQIPFFSALCCSLVMASCGGGATEKTSDESSVWRGDSLAQHSNISCWMRPTTGLLPAAGTYK